MIDTVRISGPAGLHRWKYELEKYYAYKKKGKKEVIQQQLVANKKGKFRVFYSPAQERIDVEFNLGKLLFNYNVFNYEKSTSRLLLLLARCGEYFFSRGDFFISRLDIGGVFDAGDINNGRAIIETFRRTRVPGGRIRKYKHQNYEDSVFYKSENWSVKVYLKGPEMMKVYKQAQVETVCGVIDAMPLVRFEKTYRSGEFERLGMEKTPYWGIHVSDFDLDIVMRDFYKVFEGWERQRADHFVDLKGAMGALQMFDRQGKFEEACQSGVYSKATIQRYRKLRHDLRPSDWHTLYFDFPNNLCEKGKQLIQNVINFGAVNLFVN